jgi:hypothetical protein
MKPLILSAIPGALIFFNAATASAASCDSLATLPLTSTPSATCRRSAAWRRG